MSENEEKLSAGAQFVKFIRPGGAILVLALFVIVTALMLFPHGAPVSGYTPPESAEYYASHVSELAEEVRDNLVPKLGITAEVTETGGKVAVKAGEKDAEKLRLAAAYYYDTELFEFITD